jgi:hypothetical protein
VAIENKIQCSGTNYIATGGAIYSLSGSMMTNFGFSPGEFVDGGLLCSNLLVSSQPLGQYIRVPNGTVYYVGGGQKRAFASYTTFQSSSYCNNSCTLINVSDFFANSLPSGANL